MEAGKPAAPETEALETAAGPKPETEAERPHPSPEERPLIRASCPLYACRDCRTKTGWPHQKWCGMKQITEPGCGDCRYWSVKKDKCDHPALRRGGDRK